MSHPRPQAAKAGGSGYAGTIYRGQGKTLDRSYLLHSHHWRDQSSYVALTRAREATQIFVSGQEDVQRLARQMARSASHGASLRYATEDERNRQKVERFTESDIIDDVRRGRGKDYSKLDNLLKKTNQDKEKDAPNTAKETEAKPRSAPPAIDREASIPLPDQEKTSVAPPPYLSETERMAQAMRNRGGYYAAPAGLGLQGSPKKGLQAYERAYGKEQESLSRAIAGSSDPADKSMLRLRSDIARADRDHMLVAGGHKDAKPGEKQTLRTTLDDKLGEWDRRGASDPERYPPLNRDREVQRDQSASKDERSSGKDDPLLKQLQDLPPLPERNQPRGIFKPPSAEERARGEAEREDRDFERDDD